MDSDSTEKQFADEPNDIVLNERSSQVTLSQLLRITLAFASVFALAKVIGPTASTAILLLACLLAPTIAFFIGCLLDRWSLRFRMILVAASLVSLVIVLLAVSVAFSGTRASSGSIIIGLISMWIPQGLFWRVMYRLWRSGMESAEAADRARARLRVAHPRHEKLSIGANGE